MLELPLKCTLVINFMCLHGSDISELNSVDNVFPLRGSTAEEIHDETFGSIVRSVCVSVCVGCERQ